VLKAYAQTYQYDPARWSFLTGPPEVIGELARGVRAGFSNLIKKTLKDGTNCPKP